MAKAPIVPIKKGKERVPKPSKLPTLTENSYESSVLSMKSMDGEKMQVVKDICTMMQHSPVARVGDLAVLVLGDSFMKTHKAFSLTPGFRHPFLSAQYSHDDMIGATWGSELKVLAGKKERYPIYMLPMTPELWSKCFRTRTQILYLPDISMVLQELDVRSGDIVLESGTGSAVLTHHIAKTVAPHGHVYSYEFHPGRALEAQVELNEHGLGGCATVTERDLLTDGFRAINKADAVFLDLPKPWVALESAWTALVPGGRVCSFSPCIEQVSQTCQKLADLGFLYIRTVETLMRPIRVQKVIPAVPVGLKGLLDSPVGGNTLTDAAMLPMEMENAANKKSRSRGGARGKKSSAQNGQFRNFLQPGEAGKTMTPVALGSELMQGHTGYLTFAVKPGGPTAPAVDSTEA